MGFGPFFTLFFFWVSKRRIFQPRPRNATGPEIDRRKLMENVRCASECFVALISKERRKTSLFSTYAHTTTRGLLSSMSSSRSLFGAMTTTTTTRHPGGVVAFSSRRAWSTTSFFESAPRRRGRSVVITCRVFPKTLKKEKEPPFGFGGGGSRARARKKSSAETTTRKTGKRTKTNVVSSEAKKRRENNGRRNNVARRNEGERRWTSKYQERITTKKKRDTKRKNSIFTTRAQQQTREKSETITNKKSERTKDNRYNRHRDRSKSFDLSARVTQFYPSSQSFQPFGEDPGKNAEDSERWLKIVEKINSPKNQATFTLGLLTFAYIHCAASTFLVSALLPAIGGDLDLSDGQGALLTTLFTVVYSLCLPLIGIAADKMDRKNLLAAGSAIWTAGTVMTANANTFAELVIARIVFAIGNGPQNPIAFSLLPELFPRNKNAAMSLYNMGVHFGRAISFASGAMVAAPQTATGSVFHPDLPIQMPIEFLSDIKNLGSNSILYVTGDSVVLSSNAGTAMESVGDALMANTGLGWRELFDTVAIPGFIIVPALFFIVRDPGRSEDGSSRAERRKLRRSQKRMLDAKRLLRKTRFLGVKKDKETGKLTEKSVSDLNIVSLVASYEEDKTPKFIARKARKAEDEAAANVSALAVRKAIKADKIEDLSDIIESRVEFTMKKEEELEKKGDSFFDSAVNAFKNPNFRALTLAATLTDVASWSMIAFQSTFYQRTYELDAVEYNKLLAFVIPVAGAIGGLTSGYFSDRLNAFQRKIMLAGGTILCAPLLAESLESSSYQLSMVYLFFGFMLSEFFRSPTAVMTRELDPENPSATVAAHLAVRNLTAGVGPLAVAALISKGGLEIKDAMLFAPAMYVLGGMAFWYADSLIEKTKVETQRRKSAISR